MVKVSYDAGHGLHTPGKRSPDGEHEWSFNNIVAKAFAEELSTYNGVELKRTDDPTGEKDVSLTDRIIASNRFNADYHFSFHANAFNGKWGEHGGTEIYYSSTNGKKLAEAIFPAQLEATGLLNRGIKQESFAVIGKNVDAVGVLLEIGFMDSNTDIKVLRDESKMKAIGKAVAQAFAKYVKLSKSVVKPEVNPTTNKKENLGVDGSWGPATTKALQRAMGTVVDGVISGQPRNTNTLKIPSVQFGKGGSLLIKALQRKFGTIQDGYISYPSNLIKALERHLGVSSNGVVDSTLVKALQKRLNDGTF